MSSSWFNRAPRAHQLDGALEAAPHSTPPESTGAPAAPAEPARPAPQTMLQYLMSPLAKAVLVSTASSVLSGYDQGVIAAAMLTMKLDLDLDGVEQEMSIGVMNIAAAGGGLMAGMAAERFGRKRAIALANGFFLLGSLAIALAESFAALFVGRLLQGVGVGFALVVAPIFTSELVPAEVRGRLVSLGDVCTNAGILLGYSAGLLFFKAEDGWRYMFWLGCAPALLIVVSIFSAPESPRWLVSVGRVDEARTVVHRLHPDEAEAAASLDEMVAAVAAVKDEPKSGWADVLWHPDPVVRGMIWRGLAIALFSQLTGTEAVVYFAGDIVQEAGLVSMRSILLAIMAVGACKLVFLLGASSLFDRVGRRPMLLASAAGLAASLLVLAASTWGDAPRPVLAITGLCAFMASFSIGFSPLVYVVCSELFPLGVRARAMSCALFITRVTAGLISSVFVSLRTALTPHGAWLLFVPIALAAFAFVYAYVPETNGLGLEGVQTMFTKMADEKAARRARTPWAHAQVGGGASVGTSAHAAGGVELPAVDEASARARGRSAPAAPGAVAPAAPVRSSSRVLTPEGPSLAGKADALYTAHAGAHPAGSHDGGARGVAADADAELPLPLPPPPPPPTAL
ncbi:hypothetical protein KFE25_001210 [Diacronema lutheri]|uniref:Major facilitator superfamily (MFS) profile domain-containing protein n=2 Tax=Diacronema lutheri TaxID=2081491 RepID=A0A8J5X5N0_DIALT|nr:hypothetical protein KFE25_001210 [Diacronema lutheri]